jgi:hypothetical protein
MPVSRGWPKGSGGTTGGTGGSAGGSGGGSSAEAAQVDISSLVSAVTDITSALNTGQTPKEVMTNLNLYSNEGLVVLAAPDYRAYFDLTAFSGSILKVMNTGTLKVYGDLYIDNGSTTYFDNGSTITVKGN